MRNAGCAVGCAFADDMAAGVVKSATAQSVRIYPMLDPLLLFGGVPARRHLSASGVWDVIRKAHRLQIVILLC